MSDLLASASASEKNANGNSTRDSATPTSQQLGEEKAEEEQEQEMAFGPTPAYSLSKAAANAAVRTWAPRLLRPPPTSGGSTGGAVGGVRLVAVCPGDVLTRMTSTVRAEDSHVYFDVFASLGVRLAATISLVASPIGFTARARHSVNYSTEVQLYMIRFRVRELSLACSPPVTPARFYRRKYVGGRDWFTPGKQRRAPCALLYFVRC